MGRKTLSYNLYDYRTFQVVRNLIFALLGTTADVSICILNTSTSSTTLNYWKKNFLLNIITIGKKIYIYII